MEIKENSNTLKWKCVYYIGLEKHVSFFETFVEAYDFKVNHPQYIPYVAHVQTLKAPLATVTL